MEDLKNCPFCRSDDVFYEQIYDRNAPIEDAFQISCGNCQIEFSCGDSTKEEIAELWNRRNEK